MDTGGCVVFESQGSDGGRPCSWHLGASAVEPAAADQHCRAGRFIEPNATCHARSELDANSMQVKKKHPWAQVHDTSSSDPWFRSLFGAWADRVMASQRRGVPKLVVVVYGRKYVERERELLS